MGITGPRQCMQCRRSPEPISPSDAICTPPERRFASHPPISHHLVSLQCSETVPLLWYSLLGHVISLRAADELSCWADDLLSPKAAAFCETGLATSGLAQDLRAAGADDDGLGVAEDGGDGEAAGALDVHEEGAWAWDESLASLSTTIQARRT